MPWCKQSSALRRFGAVNRRLRAPFTRATRDLPLPKPVKGVSWVRNRREAGECRMGTSKALSRRISKEVVLVCELDHTRRRHIPAILT
jgi:hypothetical protein